MKYLLIERKFFSQFVEGGDKEFDNYINMKSKLGVWGDDVELQAISEIYNRSIEIYSGSNKPLKTFHENINEFNLKKENEEGNIKEEKIKISPIRISYHGKEHYNSIIPRKNNYEIWINCRFGVLTQNPGEYEEQILKMKEEENKEKKRGGKRSGRIEKIVCVNKR